VETRYCVVYRVGGTENFKWRRTLAMSESEADEARERTLRMGYPAFKEVYEHSLAIGLPETYEG
jgi:hypothetical protein